MLIKKLPYILTTLLITIVIGCGTSNPLVDEAESNIASQNYEAALASAEQSISQHPGDPLGYYYKAVALGSIAEQKGNPAARAFFYKKMNETFDVAQKVADTSETKPSQIENIGAYKTTLWGTEHDKGVFLVRDDSLAQAAESNITHNFDVSFNAADGVLNQEEVSSDSWTKTITATSGQDLLLSVQSNKLGSNLEAQIVDASGKVIKSSNVEGDYVSTLVDAPVSEDGEYSYKVTGSFGNNDANIMGMLHLQNATTIQPDSSISWNALAQVAAINKKFEVAANAKEKYLSIIQDTVASPNDYLQLASYYYNLDDQQQLVATLEKGQSVYPTNQDIISNLADGYNRIGQPKKAISTVQQLVDQAPENPQYRLVLGTQLYQQSLQLNDSLLANGDEILTLQQQANRASGSKKQELQNQIEELEKENSRLQERMDELTAQAEEELKTTLEYRPNDANAYNTLGVIYQNKAKYIFDKRNRTNDNQRATELDKQGKEMLRKAMGYYEKAVEIEPDNKLFWKRLFQIYTALGMDQKAQDAMEKAGMN